MPKRPLDDPARPPKRARLQAPPGFPAITATATTTTATALPHADRLSRLSDELLLRILHRLPAAAHLLAVARVSRRFWRLAGDGQLWRALYRKRFRGPGLGSGSEVAPDWKRAYRLRLNWTRGTCAVAEVPLDTDDGALLQVTAGLAVTADARHGVRVWGEGKGLRQALIAQAPLPDTPTALSVSAPSVSAPSVHTTTPRLDIAVGLRSGGFCAWRLDRATQTLTCRGTLLSTQAQTAQTPPTAIAYAHPYVLTATDAVVVSLYALHGGGAGEDAPTLLTALAAPTAQPPLALAVHPSSSTSTTTQAVAVLAYTVAARRGWALGVQELHIGGERGHPPSVVSSGLAFSPPVYDGRRPVDDVNYEEEDDDHSDDHPDDHPPDDHLPTALAYAHPHLLATLPDNTMVLHRCRRGGSPGLSSLSLSLSPGVRLWGHTSGIAAAAAAAAAAAGHPGRPGTTATTTTTTATSRARAVSVSRRGDELRVWELDGRPPVAAEPGRSVVVRVAGGGDGDDGGEDGDNDDNDDNDNNNASLSVGLDDERVVVLKDARSRRARLLVYDFS